MKVSGWFSLRPLLHHQPLDYCSHNTETSSSNDGAIENDLNRRVELENAAQMIADLWRRHREHPVGNNKWIERLYNAVLDGDYERLRRLIRAVAICLFKRAPERYRQWDLAHMWSFIIQVNVLSRWLRFGLEFAFWSTKLMRIFIISNRIY